MIDVAAVIGILVWVVLVGLVAWDEARRERQAPPAIDESEPALRDFQQRTSYDAIGPEAHRDQLRPRVRDV